MSDREKKLLLFFSLAGFAIVNFLVFNYAVSKKAEIEGDRKKAEIQLAQAKVFHNSSEEILDEMDWLDEHEPEPAAPQEVQTKLQAFVEREAKATGLTIKSQKASTQAEPGKIYHRVRLLITVTGNEQSLYQWFGRINVPDQFRSATQIRLSPNAQDDTQIDCTATVEQWFVPATT